MGRPGRRARSAGAIVLFGILLLAGCGGRRQPQTDFTTEGVPGCDIVVAQVNGEPITMGEVYQKIRINYPMMLQQGPGLATQAKEVLKSMVSERCLADYASTTGDDRDPDFLRSLYFARLSLLSQTTVRNQITNKVAPSEAWVDSIYQANKDRLTYKPQVWWRHIQVGSEAEARRVIAELRAGADFAGLATRVSKDRSSVAEGGKMPPHPQGPQVAPFGNCPEIDAALFTLQNGEVSGPVRSSFGWHVLKVEARREARAPTLDEVRQQVVGKVIAQRQNERHQKLLDSLKATYRVTIDDEAVEQFRRLLMNEADLFTAAQQEKDPAYELKLYQEIRERFPKSDRAAEALFMIGFVYLEKLNDLPHAREALERFLADYPDHAMAASARTLLDEARGGGKPDTPGGGG